MIVHLVSESPSVLSLELEREDKRFDFDIETLKRLYNSLQLKKLDIVYSGSSSDDKGHRTIQFKIFQK